MADSTLITVRHATPARNLSSIFRTGLNNQLATGKLKVVWVHLPRKTRWAVAHCAERHHTPARQMAILELRIPQADLKKNRDGIYTIARTVRPQEIYGVNGLRIALASVR
jgi:hypothetical protein